MGRKLSMIYSIPVHGPTVYADSDILYFHGARELADLAGAGKSEAKYLLDCWPSLDDRLLNGEEEKLRPVNAGFFFVNQPMDWSGAMERFNRMEGSPKFFTEQTLVHLTLRAQGARAFDPERYVMRNEDQWRYRDEFVNSRVCLRHYISSFRHKMWLRVRGAGGSSIPRSAA